MQETEDRYTKDYKPVLDYGWMDIMDGAFDRRSIFFVRLNKE